MFGAWTMRGDVMHAEIEVGMPLMGQLNLGETPLLKLLGDMRWRHAAELSGVHSSRIVDADGARLYGTIFYFELWFPPEQPMSSIGENHQLVAVNTLVADSEFKLDGFFMFYPASWPDADRVPVTDVEHARAVGVPFARMSNAYVKMVQGASWLKKALPVSPGFAQIPRSEEPNEVSKRVIVVSGGNRSFGPPPATFSPLTEDAVHVEYVPDPDRDLNGAGLLYFANYPAVLDYAERRALPGLSPLPIGDRLLDLRSVVHRRSAYVANVVPPDEIDVYLQAWIHNPFLSGDPEPEASSVRLYFDAKMFRRSDGRKMMVSNVEKEIAGMTVGEAGLVDGLRSLAAVAAPT